MLTPTSPAFSILDTVNNPLSQRARAIAEWTGRGGQLSGLAFNLAVNYAGGYRNDESAVRHSVDAWTTLDVQLSYRFITGHGWLDDTQFRFNAANVTNSAPPFADRNLGFDYANALPYGRVVSCYLEKKW